MRAAIHERAKIQIDQAVVLAWQIQRLEILAMQANGGKRLPALADVLRPTRPAGPVTSSQFARSMQDVAALYGLKLKVTRPSR